MGIVIQFKKKTPIVPSHEAWDYMNNHSNYVDSLAFAMENMKEDKLESYFDDYLQSIKEDE